MVACLSPSDAYCEENLSTLNYATKASFIQNQPNQNVDPKLKLIADLRAKVKALQMELEGANNHIAMLTEMTGSPQTQQ
jgi:kinesin family protein 4/21/27